MGQCHAAADRPDDSRRGQRRGARAAGPWGARAAAPGREGGGAGSIEGLRSAAKTGSAETPRGQPHAWFAAYAPTEEPRVALAVLVEHGRRGGLVAAPIAKAVLQAAFGITPTPEAHGGPP